MHFGMLTIIEKTEDVDTAVAKALEPFGDGKEWDWYQIGGRHTGCLDGYDPDKDPANTEVCNLCAGTGVRPDMQVASGCNGCQGKGQRVKWPTQWAKHGGDIAPLDSVSQETLDSMFYGVCTADGEWFTRERYESKPWAKKSADRFKIVEQELPPIDWLKKTYPDYLAVVVDCHN